MRNIRELLSSGLPIADLPPPAPFLGLEPTLEHCHPALEIYRRSLGELDPRISDPPGPGGIAVEDRNVSGTDVRGRSGDV
ncbi:hypothetical protein [Nocardiopsis halophila]|uniref:hypothetical protein n=1 Tax=Nocardiopsis halophila TaxID=141692 RepID=UPI00034532E8|nr:hypothetical protein [Nocardiopsis halophila]